MKKIFLLIIICTSLLISAVSVNAAYSYTINWFYNNTPVKNVSARNYACKDNGCYTLGDLLFNKTSATNQITVPYQYPAPIFGYATYWFADCYTFQEMWWKPTGHGSWTDNANFTKKDNCLAQIQNVMVKKNETGLPSIIIAADVQSALTERQLAPYGEPNDDYFRKKFIFAQTNVTLIIKNSTGDMVYNKTKEEYILWDTSNQISFNFTPLIGQEGNYTYSIITGVPDCKCINYTPQKEDRILTVTGEDTRCYNDSECDDGLYCNGHEACQNNKCVAGIPLNCSMHDLPGIAACYFTPDNISTTWDYFSAFTSTCDEENDKCTIEELDISHTCNKTECGAECEADIDCNATICSHQDYCNGTDYYHFPDIENTCEQGCTCTNNSCTLPIVYQNDSRCYECVNDTDCNSWDADYCGNNAIKHNEGVCIENRCHIQTTKMEDCSERNGIMNDCGLMEWGCSEEINKVDCTLSNVIPDDKLCPNSCQGDLRKEGHCDNTTSRCSYITQNCNDGIFCNGQETCENAACIAVAPINCSIFDLPPVATCGNDPDNNPFTFDSSLGFISTCNEELDACTNQTLNITHTCDKAQCGAKCVSDTECNITRCDGLDGCVGKDYYNYSDVNNTCDGCACTNNSCTQFAVYENYPLCTECQNNSQCNHLDNSYCNGSTTVNERGVCVDYECKVNKTTENCDDYDNTYCSFKEIWQDDSYCSKGECKIKSTLNKTCPAACYKGDCVDKAFYYTTNWFYQGSPVNNVKAINYKCNDEGCNMLGEKTFEDISETNSITVPYTIPSQIYGYATYWFADCYAFQEMAWKPTKEGSWTDDVEFTKKEDCTATINNFVVVFNESSEVPIIVKADVNSPISEIKLPPYGEPTEEEIVKEFLSAQTYITLIIKNSTNDIVYNATKEEYLYWDTASTINFDWIPRMGQEGEYTVYLTTGVPDCKCTNYVLQSTSEEISVNETHTRCYSDADCDDDGLYCNGQEKCVGGFCQASGLIDCNDNISCTNDTCNEEMDKCDNIADDLNCDDGLYCNGEEYCDIVNDCQNGMAINCSSFDLNGIASCNNNPDNNPFTWDYFAGFTSVCDEINDKCVQGTTNLTHACDKTQCGAECENNNDCKLTDCDYLDGCVGNDYYDYTDNTNICLDSCECTNNSCGEPTVYYNDSRCTKCQTDDDCDHLDDDYCDGDLVKHDEGKCVNYECKPSTTTVKECADKCEDGGCITINCYSDSDCGAASVNKSCVGLYFVVTNIKPICNLAGTKDSYCSDDKTVVTNDKCNYICSYSDGCDYTQCSNGIDDDNDGQIDMADPGCSDYSDDDEYNLFDLYIDGGYIPNPPLYDNEDAVIRFHTHNTPGVHVSVHVEAYIDGVLLEWLTHLPYPYYSSDLDWGIGLGTPLEAGWHNLTIITDVDNQYIESNETNNIFYYSFEVLPSHIPECVKDDDCNSLDTDYCNGDMITHNEGKCINNKCKTETTIVEDCDDSLYCNGQETCNNAQCVLGISVNCNDGDVCTQDSCNEATDSCFNNEISNCCVTNADCGDSNACTNDVCADNKCQHTTKSCNDGVACTQDSCNPQTGCANTPDNSYCNDGLWCDGNEVCDPVNGCQKGTIDCSANNIAPIGTCTNNPDNNKLTWDYFAGFTSVCDEINDKCPSGTINLTHTCNISSCGAQCEKDADCDDSNPHTIHKCSGCLCQSTEIKCFTDADCDDSDYITVDVCVNAGTSISYCEHKKPRIDTLPRKKFLINTIRTNKLVYDEMKAGDLLYIDLNFENIGRYDTKSATIRVTVPELGISRKLGPFNGPGIDDAMSKGLYVEIPEDAKPGVYSARISLSDLRGIRRTKHRDFSIAE